MGCRIVFLLLFAVSPALFAQTQNFPHIEKNGDHDRLMVDGKPYFILGAQVHNSSGFPAAMDAAWPIMHALGCNPVMVPVYWEVVEPKQGSFDFSGVDAIVNDAREQGLHLTLLWFGTWKNGAMTYVPQWVKENPAKYPP